MQLKLSFAKNTLKLPKRFEILAREIDEKGAELTRIVRKIDKANTHIQNLLGKVHVGGVGQFQLFLGESGSGKTTFLRTLPNFFKNITITSFTAKDNFESIANEIEKHGHIANQKIFVIDERDNPRVDVNELKIFFERLRVLFRKKEGAVLIVWPITDKASCDAISQIAWDIGRESISPVEGAVYNFEGLPKSEYFDVADETVRNLNNGESLDSFGITRDVADSILVNSNTIGDFYAKIERLAYELNEKAWKTLEEKVTPKIWILLPGDSLTEIDRTVKALTQGIESRVDVDRMLAYLDDESNESAYLNEWRQKRSHAGFLFRLLDVRLFSVSPNLALACARLYGDDSATKLLKKRSEAKNVCHDLVGRSGFYLALTSQSDSSKRTERATKEDTQYEYLRLQQSAKSQDKELNKSFAKALQNKLDEDEYSGYDIKCEKQELTGTKLKPDIQIEQSNKQIICLEITWRTTGLEVPGEIESRQNTLTPGHIQKYILDKTMEYVKELGL